MEAKNSNIVRVVDTGRLTIDKNPDGTFDAGYSGKQHYRIKGKILSKIYNDSGFPWAFNFKRDAKVYSNYRDVWAVDGCVRYGIVIIDDDTGKIIFYKCNNEEETEFISDDGTIIVEAVVSYGAEMSDGDFVTGDYKLGYVKAEDSKGIVYTSLNKVAWGEKYQQ